MNSSSYVVWVTVPTPVIFILIMTVKGFTLPGMKLGVRMYLLGHDAHDNPPDWGAQLRKMDMWAEAMG